MWFRYNGSETVSVSMIFAKYNGNALESVTVKRMTCVPGMRWDLSLNMQGFSDFDRLFIWDGTKTMKPLTDARDLKKSNKK